MDENNNTNNEKSGSLFGSLTKDGIKGLIKRMPFGIKVKIIFAIIGVCLLLLIIASFITSIPHNHLFFSDKVSSDNYDVTPAYADYIANPCEPDDKKCSERQKANYDKLSKDQAKFLKKLDKVSNKYNLSKEQKYIILTTIFYGNDENFFYEKTDDGNPEFTTTSGAYTLDEDEEGTGEDTRDLEGQAYIAEKDTIKELAKQFSYYPVNCSYTVEKVVDGETVKETVVEELKDDEGNTFTFGFWQHLTKTSNDEGFDDAKAACKEKPDGKVTSGDKMVGQAGGETGINKYYEYLETNDFLDNRDVFQRTFFKPYMQAKKLEKWDEKNLVKVRSQITESIQKIVADKMYLDEKYGINNQCGPNGATSGVAAAGNDSSYWWPLADSESNGFASSESSTKEGSKFGMRFHPNDKVWKLHAGMDIGTPINTLVIASKSGTVEIAKGGCTIGVKDCNGGAGNYINLQHSDGSVTRYLHLTSFRVSVGQEVKQGQVIALSGDTGNTDGAHLHFEIRINGSPVDPANYISSSNQRPGSTINTTTLENSLNSSDNSSSGQTDNSEVVPTTTNNIGNLGNIKAKFLVNPRFSSSVALLENSGGFIDVESLKSTANTNKGANRTPVDSETIASYTSTVDIWTNLSDQILAAAGVDRNGNMVGGGVTYHEKGYCQRWVRMVYEKAGLGSGGFAGAIDGAAKRTVSKSMSAIPVGATVYGRSNSVWGHVGIYIGHGKVINNVGRIKIDDLKYWATRYKWIGWGWENSEEKLTTASASGPVNLDSNFQSPNCITTNGDGSVLVGNDNQQTICLTLKNNNFKDSTIAAMLGNIEAECNFNPSAVEGNTGRSAGEGHGIIQFSWDRRRGLMEKYGDAWTDISNQLEYMLYELETSEKASGNYIKNNNDDVDTQTYNICKKFIRPKAKYCDQRHYYGSKYVSYVQNNCGGATNIQTVSSKTTNNQNITKKIFVGDSRTVGMQQAVKTNDIWSAKVGENYDWMVKTGIPNIENQITPGTALIILMGVNDPGNVNKYANYINANANNWIAKGASVYFVSVNPVVDNGKWNTKPADVDKFNSIIKSKLNANVKYIDTFNQIKNNFKTTDGLHFTPETNKTIYNIISSSLGGSTQTANTQAATAQTVSATSTSSGHKIEKRDGITYIDNVMIVNKTYSIPTNYVPTNTYKSASGQAKCLNCINKEAYEAYTKLRVAALAANVPSSQVEIVSGYRSYQYQSDLWTKRKNNRGISSADSSTARAGHSEHQTGLAMDLGETNQSYANKAGGKFLANNAYKYGFIIRYPKGKDSVTGFIYEPWHIRYVGVDLATKLYNGGNWISLEEYFGITSKYS